MPPITVEIEIDDQGKITVGTESADTTGGAVDMNPGASNTAGKGSMSVDDGDHEFRGGGEAAEDSGMRPVKSIEEALQVAGDLLRNAPQVQDADGEAGFQQVFGKQPSPGAVS